MQPTNIGQLEMNKFTNGDAKECFEWLDVLRSHSETKDRLKFESIEY